MPAAYIQVVSPLLPGQKVSYLMVLTVARKIGKPILNERSFSACLWRK